MARRSSIIGGTILIGVGILFLLLQMFPNFATRLDLSRQWPLLIVGTGGIFFLGALFGSSPLAIPGTIVAGTGGLLYYQNLTGNWDSWAFAWTLYPGFVGVGIILMNLLNGGTRRGLREGASLLAISTILFLVFGAFFNGFGEIGRFWPVLLIVAGGWMLLQNRAVRRR